MIALGADHGGYRLKEAIKKYLDSQKIEYKDFGTDSEASVDYPPIAAKVAHFVADGHAEKGVLCCGTGIGMSIAANKVKGIRAAVCADAYCAEITRHHNNANILCMGGRVIHEDQAVEFTRLFLGTSFDGGRHQRRIDEISAIERGEL
ncbi:MAG: ribose 5-phosphate isomerase B [Oscillospiraceae bacterium]|jgi:ribose 5-phosphate isomerase B|nr:ribose 5-phosphate isomerase B [Oscillospiraceae bacterium]